MKTMSLAEAQALALRNGGTLNVGGRAFNTARLLATSPPPKPKATIVAPQETPKVDAAIVDALRSQSETFIKAIDRFAAAVKPEPAKPLASLAVSALPKPLYSYKLEVTRNEHTKRISEVVVLRDGQPRYLAVPEIDPSTGLIQCLSLNPIGPEGPAYQ